MSPAQCASVFEPYVRSADGHGGGNGLGLAIAKSAAEAMGGTVGCGSGGAGLGSRRAAAPLLARSRLTRLLLQPAAAATATVLKEICRCDWSDASRHESHLRVLAAGSGFHCCS